MDWTIIQEAQDGAAAIQEGQAVARRDRRFRIQGRAEEGFPFGRVLRFDQDEDFLERCLMGGCPPFLSCHGFLLLSVICMGSRVRTGQRLRRSISARIRSAIPNKLRIIAGRRNRMAGMPAGDAR